MMKKIVFFSVSALFLVTACSENKKENAAPVQERAGLEELKADVASLEDSLKSGKLNMDPSGSTCVKYAETCLKIYELYPSSNEAPVYLDRAHMIFSSCNLHQRAVVAGDELIKKYPDYKGRSLVLASLASAYDMFILPRDKSKVIYYYNLLLKENPDLPKEDRETYEFRLKYIDLSYDELIELQQAKRQNS